MAAARCSECGGEATGRDRRVTSIIHKGNCPVGIARQKRVAIQKLVKAAQSRGIMERLLDEKRHIVQLRAQECDELGISRTEIARAADLNRSRLYKILPTG